MPTDFQLHRKMKLKLYFRFSLQWKNKIGLPFLFFIFPRQEGNGIRIHLMLSVFLFLQLKKKDFKFLFRFSFSYGILKTDYDSFLVFFPVYGIETDNLCVSGKMSQIKTLSAGFLSNRNILTRGLSLKSRLDMRIQRAAVYEALKGFVITKE